MKEMISRRAFAKLVGIGAISVAAAPLKAHESATAAVESQLASKLDERAKGLLASALRSNANASRGRLRHKLAENSEPCFVFRAEAAKK
ncbi:MAG: hypothetical protein M3R13_11450 [Armatimonadota bacterium]|nr:hypothetical protein [Armatimonadota bacterium]